MVSLDSSFLIDLLAGDEAARREAERLVEARTGQFITAPAAAEVLVGGHRIGGRYLVRTKELLDSLPLLQFDRESYYEAGRIGAALLTRGTPVGQSDLYIAAISLRHGHPIVTRDQAFGRIPGLTVLSY